VRTRDRNVRRERGDKGRARSSAHPLRLVAHHDTPLIAERAAMRGRGATECGLTRLGTRTLVDDASAFVAHHDAQCSIGVGPTFRKERLAAIYLKRIAEL
jgi:hypothetical protein